MEGSRDLYLKLMSVLNRPILRWDLWRLDKLTTSSEQPNPEKYCELFWDIWQPKAYEITSVEPLEMEAIDELPALPPDIEEGMLNKLAELEQKRRLTYQSDCDWDDYDLYELLLYVHVAAARAFALKRRDGYSEDVEGCLANAWPLGRLIIEDPDWTVTYAPGCIISTCAVNGLILVELSRVKQARAQYGEALHLLTSGVEYLDVAAAAAQDDEGVKEAVGNNPEREAQEKDWRSKLKDYLFSLTLEPQDAVELSIHLLNHGRGVDWKQIATDCKVLVGFWYWFLGEEDQLIKDAEGNETTWLAFWRYIQGRVEEKLSPNDLRELLQEREDDDSQSRLKAYFFEGELWEELPERAKQALVDAERTWFSGRKGRPESVLNDIQVAVESLCYCLIWESLRQYKGDQSCFEFLAEDKRLQESGHQPTVASYAWACKRPFFQGFVASLGLDEGNKRFLSKELPNALVQLRDLRNIAEHDPTHKWTKDEVTPIFKTFLGIGCPGGIPRLAEIKRKVAPSAKRRSPLGRW